jgi:retron-type reverse transcriptase
MSIEGGYIIDLDISKYFDSIPHDKLREILGQRVSDGVIRRVIGKWLHAGVMEAGKVSCRETGSPQGGVISPLLSNIYLHEVMDDWFVFVVKKFCGSSLA